MQVPLITLLNLFHVAHRFRTLNILVPIIDRLELGVRP
jgi:hypothetical protein